MAGSRPRPRRTLLFRVEPLAEVVPVRAVRARRGECGTTSKNTKDVSVSEATREELEAEIASLRAELKTVRKENPKLATERDILRKATKFLAQEMTW